MKKTALISVSDKTDIIKLAQVLTQKGYTLLATGNTAKILAQNNLPVSEVSELTGFPEILEGRVKTLHPLIFGGILFKRDDDNHVMQAAANGITSIDVVCVNLYPFEKVASSPGSSNEDLIENIDIGGPSLIRAAAKNHKDVLVLTSPDQYDEFIENLHSGKSDLAYKQKLAVAAYMHTAHYDTVISVTLNERLGTNINKDSKSTMPLRYGENPHQKAQLEGRFFDFVEILHGKELSYNNILDIVAAVNVTEEFSQPAAAIIKHNNPAGVALGKGYTEAFRKALACDPVSAFGGIVSLNGVVDAETAYLLNQIFLEVIIADDFDDEAFDVLKKKKDRRLLRKKKRFDTEQFEIKSVPGGIIRQEKDIAAADIGYKKVTEADGEIDNAELDFAWRIVKHIRSNAIVFTKDLMTLGIGGGQVSRIDSVKLAAMKAKNLGHDLSGTIAASDAFFPFADGVEECKKAGAVAVVQPGGSVRDHEVIEAANKLNLIMYFTNTRHFKH